MKCKWCKVVVSRTIERESLIADLLCLLPTVAGIHMHCLKNVLCRLCFVYNSMQCIYSDEPRWLESPECHDDLSIASIVSPSPRVCQ